jgi:hypothetical protein
MRQRKASSRANECPKRGGIKEKYDLWRHDSTLGNQLGSDESTIEALSNHD